MGLVGLWVYYGLVVLAVAGVVEQAGRRVVPYGSLARGDRRVLDGDTVFEIGSVTKVFTSPEPSRCHHVSVETAAAVNIRKLTASPGA